MTRCKRFPQITLTASQQKTKIRSEGKKKLECSLKERPHIETTYHSRTNTRNTVQHVITRATFHFYVFQFQWCRHNVGNMLLETFVKS
jgi:hypothetical protein